ncbi:MAG: glycine cleavage system aminomethyltransferase GcvT [Gammaproteobacteria bacterium]|nr:glycine cleavage system aminomethyltransferase GcvT [Gammaproteobacteria bacterium]
MTQHTSLYELHKLSGAKLVDFAGWEMPLHYGSQLQEHLFVREHAGMFDVSHMAIVDVLGTGARDFLRYILANDIDKLVHRGKALYTCMLNDHGGVIDDLIVYFLDAHYYRLVLNAGTRQHDLAWLNKQAADFAVGLQERNDLAILAIQGPEARAKVLPLLPPHLMDAASTLAPFECAEHDHHLIARTGYTGEDGFEIMLPANKAIKLWEHLIQAGVRPIGLGARDTLRLEAGLNLYGLDMDESTTPLESNLAWTVAWQPSDRLFIGRAALELQKSHGIKRKLVGLVLEGKGVLRSHQKVRIEGNDSGMTTSGSFSPTLGVGIALARIPVTEATHCEVEIRGQWFPAKIIKPPFVRQGKQVF